MIVSIGDSHSHFTFQGIHDCHIRHIGSITMHRVGRDMMDFQHELATENLKEADIVVFCFGEIDIRTHIHKQVEMDRCPDEVIDTLVNNYVKAINSIRVPEGVTKAVLLPVPPCPKDRTAENPNYPFAGTDEQRVTYNKMVCDKLRSSNLGFLDISQVADDRGLLKADLSDGSVHVRAHHVVCEAIEALKKQSFS